MNQLITLAAVLAAIAAPRACAQVVAGPVTNNANGHIYYLLAGGSWPAAEAQAVALRGHLATVNNINENIWIFNTFAAYGGATNNLDLWIGLTDQNVQAIYKWIDGDTSAFRNWASGEPNNANGNEHYGMIFRAQSPRAGLWNDAVSSAVLRGVVEVIPGFPGFPDGFNPGANNAVLSLVVQTDGKILVGGGFTTLTGQPRNRIARLNGDGTLDSGFDPNANDEVDTLAVQADGQILVGGRFTALGGQARNRIARLNADGTLDSGFNPNANGAVVSLAVQADGKILVGGAFTTLGGQTRNRIARLNASGTLDSGFNPNSAGAVEAIVVLADGKIMVGGEFSMLGGQSREQIARLNVDGTLDSGFNTRASYSVASLAVQADGKILVGGFFSRLGGQTHYYLGRLNADGTLDSAFNPILNGFVATIGLQTDGKILVGGGFTTVSEEPRRYIARLNANGSLDSGFNPRASDRVEALTVQADGKILVGGSFTNLGGQTRNYLARLNNTEPATQRLTRDGSTLTWLRSGTSPEVWRTTYEHSADGLAWTYLGAGTRLPVQIGGQTNGWQFIGAMLSPGGLIRARGFVNCGMYNSSGWFVETTIGLSTTLDNGFNPWVNGAVAALALQGDGKILVGGLFDSLAGQPRSNLARLHNDGTLDKEFDPAPDNAVLCTTAQTDGKLLVGGQFANIAGHQRENLARLKLDGALDITFAPDANGVVNALLLQSDGKILVGGEFTFLGGQPRSHLGRLKPDGTLDADFDPAANSMMQTVNSLAMQADGKILVGGLFTSLGGQPNTNLARFNANGILDASFNPGANDAVYMLVEQADGRILAGGAFTVLGGQPRNHLARLNANGTLDSGFNPDANDDVNSLVVQADGKILVGGWFTILSGQSRACLARLNADGTLDNYYDPWTTREVYALALQADGKLVVGGAFTYLAGLPRNGLARLNNVEPATQSLSRNGATLTWLRAGASPEIARATFDATTNGTDWVSLGTGQRITSGWQLTAQSLPPNTIIRARGQVAGGYQNGSGWHVETVWPAAAPVLWNDGFLGFQSNWFGFTLSGSAGSSVIVETSTNLATWVPLRTNLLYNGPSLFRDSANADRPRNFYRLKLLAP